MSKKSNPTVIGGFIVGALVLAVLAVMVLGSGRLFTTSHKFVLFFEGSVAGLNPGAPVVFRGVRVGKVSDVRLMADPDDLSMYIPVVIEIEEGTTQSIKEPTDHLSMEEIMQLLVEKGLRAQLSRLSLVTGQSAISFDFFPEMPVKLVGLPSPYPELPTIPSPLEKMAKTLEELPLDEIAQAAKRTLEGIDRVINSGDLTQSVVYLRETLEMSRLLMTDWHEKTVPLLESLTRTADSATDFIDGLDKDLQPVVTDLNEAIVTARDALAEVQRVAEAAGNATAPDSALMLQVSESLRQLGDAARSIRVLADYLEQHPEALLSGKQE